MITVESEYQKEYGEMVAAIQSGDLTAFERYSGWMIWDADRLDKFQAIRRSNHEIEMKLDMNADLCRGSL